MSFSLTTFLKGLLIQNELDRTKQLQLTVSPSATTGTSTTLVAAQTTDVTVTLPNSNLDLNTVVTANSTTVLTNKTINPATNTIPLVDGHILVGSALNKAVDVAVTGDVAISNTGVTSYVTTVPVAKGGTGQVTANAGLNALLPSQTAQNGKVLSTDGTNTSWSTVSGTGTVTNVATGTGLTGGPITTTGTIALANTAVAPGSYTLTNLTVDQQGRITAASNGTASTPALIITPVSTTPYTTLTTDEVLLVDATSGSITVNLYNPATNSGKILRIKKIDSSLNFVQVTTSGGTIDGVGSLRLYSQYEEITLLCDGLDWQIIADYIDSGWINDGPITFGCTAGTITKSSTTVQDSLEYRRDRSEVVVRWNYNQSSGTGGSNGTGFVLLPVPAAVVAGGGINTGLINTMNITTTNYIDTQAYVSGGGILSLGTNERLFAYPVNYNGDAIAVYLGRNGSNTAWDDTHGPDFGAAMGMSIEVRFPVPLWRG